LEIVAQSPKNNIANPRRNCNLAKFGGCRTKKLEGSAENSERRVALGFPKKPS
jgi:hypothetical protein